MHYKKFILVFTFSFLLFGQTPIVLAAPPDNQLSQYLSQIGWTKQDLQDYLNYYEIPLDKIQSMTELKRVLGTPVNSSNYQELLARYYLTDQQLKALLNYFGDSLDQYKFIEDLDSAVSFYTDHRGLMTQIKNELATTGISQSEVKKFFSYLAQVEENNKYQLDKLQALDNQMENFINQTGPNPLNDTQINELAKILIESADIYEITVKFKFNNKSVPLNHLLEMKGKTRDLYMAIYSNTGQLLIDFTIPGDFFQGMVSGWENMFHLGELANELVDFLHDQKMNNTYK